jgi:CheY-like chemotaxis protein
MSIYIVDDILASHLNVVTPLPLKEFQIWKGDLLLPNDVVLVRAEGFGARRSAADNRRSRFGGLEILDEILADPKYQPAGVAVFSASSREDLLCQADLCSSIEVCQDDFVPFLQVPAPFEDFQNCAATTRGMSSAQSAWLGLRLGAARRRLQVLNSRYRHEHRNLIAALRLYQGALICQNADVHESPKVFAELTKREKRLGRKDKSLGKDLTPVLDLYRHYDLWLQELRQTPEGQAEWMAAGDTVPGERALPADCKVLLLDDKHRELGWDLVLHQLSHARSELHCAAWWDNAQRKLTASYKEVVARQAKPFDLFLLDCNLGVRDRERGTADENLKPSGLELLDPLRDMCLELPIIMMTAYDNAELAVWALRAGCNGFFVKQLIDEHDRDPNDYYQHFVSTVRRPLWEKNLRELWLQFERCQPFQDPDFELALRYTFYLLFSLADGITWWAQAGAGARGDVTRGDTAHEHAARATESWISRAAVISLLTLPYARGKIASRARHSTRSISPRQVLKLLDYLLSDPRTFPSGSSRHVLKRSFKGEPHFPAGCRRLMRSVLSNEETGQIKPGDSLRISLNHMQRSRRGAAQFVLGYLSTCEGVDLNVFSGALHEADQSAENFLNLIKEFPELETLFQRSPRSSTRTIALIDDEGSTGDDAAGEDSDPVSIESNGWHQALQMVMGGALGYEVKWYRTVERLLRNRTSLRNIDVVLLDLRLRDRAEEPATAQRGIEALQRIKNIDPALPVIVFSSETAVIDALQCMRHGALDYVAKWLSHENRPDQWAAFTHTLCGRLEKAAELGRQGRDLRRYWGQLLAMQNDTSIRVSPLLQSTKCRSHMEAIADWPEGPGAEEIIRTIRGACLQCLLPALLLLNHHQARECLGDALPLVDDWRTRRIIGTASPDNIVAFFAGIAAERLARARCSIQNGAWFSDKSWKTETSACGYNHWFEVASPAVLQVWLWRCNVKIGHALPTRINGMTILKTILAGLDEFEIRLAAFFE